MGILAWLGGLFQIYKALNPTGYLAIYRDESAQAYNVAIGAYLIGCGIFMFGRTSRHKRVYEEAKSVIIKD